MTDKQRNKFRKVKLDEKQVKELFAGGLGIWDVTETVYEFEFDHSDRKTWLFYQKVNNIRKKLEIPNLNRAYDPMTRFAINSYIQNHSEPDLVELLRTNMTPSA